MKKIRYHVAMSLDGFIAGPHGEADWIISDPEVDFVALWAQFDTLLMGRITYEAAVSRLGEAAFQGPKVVVASRTLNPANHPGVTIIRELTADHLNSLRSPTSASRKTESNKKGKDKKDLKENLKPEDTTEEDTKEKDRNEKDIWLMGGGSLFRTLLEMRQVDTVEVSIMPVLLGAGIPLLPTPARQTKLKLSTQKLYPSGIVSLTYEVQN